MPAAPSRSNQQRLDGQEEERDAGTNDEDHETKEELQKRQEGLVLQLNAASLSDTESSSSFSSLEGAAGTHSNGSSVQSAAD